MLNNYNNLQAPSPYSLRAVLASPNNCVTIYNQNSVVQVVQGLIVVSSPISPHQEQLIATTIPLKNPQSELVDLLVTDNTRIVTLSVTTRGEFEVTSYLDQETHTTYLTTKATRFISSHRSHSSIMYVFQGTAPQFYSQVVVFQPCEQRVVATGLLPDKVESCRLTDSNIYILTEQAVNVYQHCSNHLQLLQTYPAKEMKGVVFSSGLLVLYSCNEILLMKDQKQVGTIKYSEILKILPVTLGLVVMCRHVILHLQKRGGTFVEVDRLQSSVGYKNFEVSDKQTLLLTEVETGTIELVTVDFNKADQHDHRKSFTERHIVKESQTVVSNLTLSAGYNPCLVLVRQKTNQIVIYSKVTLANVLEYQIDTTPIYDVQIEPNRPFFLLSVNGFLKRFYILYDRIQEQSQISLRVRRLVYSPTGTFVACLVGSAKYSKVQILTSDDLKQVAVLWIGQDICDLVWGSYDMNLYVVVEKGYERWSLTDRFKTKRCFQTEQSIVKACYNFWKSALILLTKGPLILVVIEEQVESSIRTGCIVTSVASLGSQILMAQQDGTLRYSNVDSKMPPTLLKIFKGEFSFEGVDESQIVCMSKSRQTVLVLRPEQNGYLQKDVVFVQRGLIKGLCNKVSLTKQKSRRAVQDMQADCHRLQDEYKQLSEHQKKLFIKQITQVQQVLEEEKANGRQLQRLKRENKQIYQNEQLKGVGELERLYDRKIAILTNRLMTQSEMNCRNSMVSLGKIKAIEASHANYVQELNGQFARKLKQLHLLDLTEKERTLLLVKEYEQKLASGQQESNDLVQKLQSEYQQLLANLNRVNFSWEDKYKKSIIEKFNAEESTHKQGLKNQQLQKDNAKLRQSLGFERNRIKAYNQQIGKLSRFIKGLQQQLDRQKANSLQLSKTNQVLSFKILESRQVILPKQQQLEDLKGKFHTFQAEFQKNLHEMGEQCQLIQQLRKENSISRKQILQFKDMYQKQRKTHVDLFYNIKQIVTESVPEDWNQNLKKLYEEIMKKGYSSDIAENTRKNKKEIMEEIHRSKNHLEQCLNKVVLSNNKIQERKSHEMRKKLRQNADLLQEINDLRTRLKKCEHLMPTVEKECKIKRRSQTVKTEAGQIAGTKATGMEQIDQEGRIRKTFYQQKSTQFKEFQSTSMEFNRTSLRKSERFARTTFRKGINANKSKQQENKEQEIGFLSRKLQLQEKIILSLRARINGIDI